MKTYTILTTCPDYGSRNVGDKLIEVRLKALLEKEIGACEFITIFREDALDDRLDEINDTNAILMPAFPIRDTPMHPGTYRLVEDLSRIKVPMIPIGANWNVYPGDAISRRELSYSDATVAFLRHIAAQVERISYREQNVRRVLHKHGIDNTVFSGDPAMFNPNFLNRPMKRPVSIDKLVFSPPLSAYYVEQAEQILQTLAEMFPAVERYCAFHLDDAVTSGDGRSENSAAMTPEVAEKNRRIRERATALGFEIWSFGGDIEGLRAYESCDLHVGYECHAHMYFLSARIPSVLIAEDARGVGFNQTLGIGGINGFKRVSTAAALPPKQHTSGYCTGLAELAVAPPRTDAHLAVRELLEDELETAFRRYVGLADFFDETYAKNMAPYLRNLP